MDNNGWKPCLVVGLAPAPCEGSSRASSAGEKHPPMWAISSVYVKAYGPGSIHDQMDLGHCRSGSNGQGSIQSMFPRLPDLGFGF